MTTPPATHAERIRDQFTRQAGPFAALAIHQQEDSLAWMRAALHLRGDERILDAGCGPGLVACHLAPHAAAVVGVDATAAMVAKARERAGQSGCADATFQEGLMEALPFPAASFDAVVTRYTFHHLLDPAAAMAELVRVCRPGGRVVVCDAAPRAASRAAYDAWERIRDPSHTSARTPEELIALAGQQLDDLAVVPFRLATAVTSLLDSSFPAAGGREQLEQSLRADLGRDELDFQVREEDGALWISFPILGVAGTVRG